MVLTKRSIINPPSSTAQLKYRPFVETGRWASKGTKPLPAPITIPEILSKVALHVCRKYLFISPKIRLTAYAVLLFFVSLLADYLNFPKTYFSSSSNAPNQYFVKLSWLWTLSFSSTFLFLSTSVYCAGDRQRVMRHGLRLLIGTLVWFLWTNVFSIIEEATGQCIYSGGAEIIYSKGRRACLKSGGKWTSFDISGHSFLLVWCSLFIIEETRPISGWDSISDSILNEEHKRKCQNEELAETPLSNLSDDEFSRLKINYAKYSVWMKLIVIFLTLLVLLWDLMLIMTAIYFHVMIEKVLGGLCAALNWYFLYKLVYTFNTQFFPGLPGQGLFKYSPDSTILTKNSPINTGGAKNKIGEEVPKFMGMPLYALKNKNNLNNELSLAHASSSFK